MVQEVGDFDNYIKVIDFDLQTLAGAIDHLNTQSSENKHKAPLVNSTLMSPNGGATPSKSQ